MKPIILATDFSPIALNAAKYAVKIAETIGADILLFNVYEVLPNYGEMVIDINVDDLKKSAETQLLNFKSDLIQQSNFGFNITTEIRLGVFNDELMSICERLNPYAVIMGSQGKTAAEHFLMGSHAGKTINHFAWPIITVPSTFTFSGIKKIGIAYDFEEVIKEELIADIKLIAKDFNASIDILNAVHEEEFNEKFTLGVAYRWSAAMSAMAGFQISDSWLIGYAYDRDTTRLGNFNSGSHEIFLRYELFKNYDKVVSPRFF